MWHRQNLVAALIVLCQVHTVALELRTGVSCLKSKYSNRFQPVEKFHFQWDDHVFIQHGFRQDSRIG